MSDRQVPCSGRVEVRRGRDLNQPIEETAMSELDLDATRGPYTADADSEPGPATGPGPALMGATTLIGDEVCNHDGESLGELKEIMLDVRSGRVAYAVLSSGGILGMGAKLFAVPWRALSLDTVNKRLVLDVHKELVDTAEGFDPDRWPDMADPAWANQIHSYYGTQPYYDRPL